MIRSTDIERFLDSQLVQYELLSVPLDDINVKASRSNQARIAPVIPTLVASYERARADGAVFPPLIGYIRTGGVILIDGNNRHEMYVRRSEPSCDVYVCDVNDEVAAQLTGLANELNGAPNSHEEKIAHAESDHRRFGFSVAESARRHGLSPNELTKHLRLRVSDERAHALGIARFNRLSERVRVQLSGIAADPTFKAVAELVVRAGDLLTTRELDALLADIRGLRSEKAQRTLIEVTEERVRLMQTERGASSKEQRRIRDARLATPWMQVKAALGKLQTVTAEEVRASCPTDVTWKELLVMSETASDVLERMRALR